jgi:outer membrane receptor protein involved in Fe transport
MSSPARSGPSRSPSGTRHSRSGLLIRTIVLSGLFLLESSTAHADPGAPYQGRPLAEVLEELRSGGLDLIFSSAVVPPDLRITVEPSTADPRGILDLILAPLGLVATEGPAGSLLILSRESGDVTLRGRIRSKARGVPVGEAVVRLSGTPATSLTGADGVFEMRGLHRGSHDIQVEATGFLPVTVTGVRVPWTGKSDLVVWLQEQPGFVTELVVTPSQLSVVDQEVGARRSVESGEVVMIPSFGGDISRVVEYLPGVTSNDNSAALHVRGSASDDVSFILDGLEIYDPYHLKSFQSPFSLIDSNVVDRVDFSGGGFTADFGDRNGGRLDIQTVLPDHPGSGEVELGTINSRFSAQGPLPEADGSWLVVGRGWYPEVFQDNIELGGGDRVDPRMGDLYSKLSFNVSPRAVISVHALGVYDYLDFNEDSEDPGEPGEEAKATTRNAYAWINFLTAQTADITSETQVSYGFIDRRRAGLSMPAADLSTVEDTREVNFLGFRHGTAWRLGDAHLIKAGMDGRALRARYEYESEQQGAPGSTRMVRLAPDGRSIGLFAAYRVRIARAFTTEIGLRWDRQDYTDDNQLSPRFNAVWQPREGTELRMSVGRYYQSQRIHELDIENGEDSFRKSEESYHSEMSFIQGLPGGLRLRLDAYYRLLTRLNPRHENLWKHLELFPETAADRVRIDPDRARLKGVEVLLQGDPARSFIWWASYTRSSAEDEIDSVDIPRSWDQPHAGKFLVGYQWRHRLMISLAGTIHTGWPTTPVSATSATDPNGAVAITTTIEERNSDRFPTYVRFDAKARYSFPLPEGSLSLTAEVINLADKDNHCCVDEFLLDPRPNGSVDVDRIYDDWRTLTPTFSVLWEF